MNFLRRWFEGAGRTQARQAPLPACTYIGGVPRWALFRHWKAKVKSIGLALLRNDAWFGAFREAAMLRGFLDEVKSIHRSETKESVAALKIPLQIKERV